MAGLIAPQRTRKSRKPTGLPNPPLVLITGQEKVGKSYEAAKGSGSDLIGKTYWIEVGGNEGTADYYGRVPGADYEIVEHDGSYQDILDAIRWVNAQPRIDGKPNMLVMDSVTSVWDMLSDEVAMFARNRAVIKANRNRSRVPAADEPVVVDPDLWNRAKDRWGKVMWLLRRHQGPVLLLARTEVVTAFENDKPTRNTTRKVKAERNLPAAVDAILDLHGLGEAWLTGVRSLHMDLQPGETRRFKDFSVDALLRRMGLQDAVESRAMYETRPDATLQEPDQPAEPAEPTAPGLSEQKATHLIAEALKHPNDPEQALREVREEHGRRTLKAVRTQSKWGVMSADALITRTLDYLAKKVAEAEAREGGDAGTGELSSTESSAGQPEGGQETPDTPRVEAPATAETPQADPEPPVDEGAPPPPDPQAEATEPEPRPEDVSEAEQPQDLPRPRPAQANKLNRVMAVLLTESEIQSRILGVTMQEFLEPVSGPEEGTPPPMTKLRSHVLEHRPMVIGLLEDRGERDIANAYRLAGKPELKIADMFSTLYNDLTTVG
ncbi:hypothetical protein GTY65_24065 [Streptomyces sp. SID8379]|uniref:hypothetical protein n=1 Tax=unclassified Streptomyces TaxID=2593676 RepID=UPI000375F464|nr:MULTISPECIES: hypothetical protein [unclassified Streptomyces]MYW67119.1 hypothetical protein [Streptomyces sp. SID8379]